MLRNVTETTLSAVEPPPGGLALDADERLPRNVRGAGEAKARDCMGEGPWLAHQQEKRRGTPPIQEGPCPGNAGSFMATVPWLASVTGAKHRCLEDRIFEKFQEVVK